MTSKSGFTRKKILYWETTPVTELDKSELIEALESAFDEIVTLNGRLGITLK